MTKIITFSSTRTKLLKGVNKLNKAVSTTLGPKGRNVVISSSYSAPLVTKDGITVAKFFQLQDPTENAGASIVKQASQRTAKVAGDGTTTAVVLATALCNNAHKLISAGYDPQTIKTSNDALLKKALDILDEFTIEIDDSKLLSVATISANNDPTLGEIIHSAFQKTGKEGVITLEESPNPTTFVDTVNGYTFDRPYLSPYFITNPKKMEAVLEDVSVLVTDKKIRSTQELVPILEHAAKHKRPLLIIADDFDPQVLQLLVVNNVKGFLKVIAVKAPSYGEMRQDLLQDLAIFCSTQLISDTKAQRLEDVTFASLGKIDKVISTQDGTTIIANPDQELIRKRIDEINVQAEDANTYFQSRHAQRIANLLGSVARIHVGAPTETEMGEIKDRLDDAIRATKAAAISGVVTGGGTALARVAKLLSLSHNSEVAKLFIDALTAPLQTIATNAGTSPDIILDKINYLTSEGFNAKTMQFTNLDEEGIFDPALVTKQALINAVSAANMIILSECAIIDDKDDLTSPYDSQSE